MGRFCSLALVRQPVKEKEDSKFKPSLLCLKTDLMSHLVHGEGVGYFTTLQVLSSDVYTSFYSAPSDIKIIKQLSVLSDLTYITHKHKTIEIYQSILKSGQNLWYNIDKWVGQIFWSSGLPSFLQNFYQCFLP